MRESEEGEGEGEASEEGASATASMQGGGRGTWQWCSAMVGARTVHGGHVLDMRHPLGHFTEHMTGSDVGKVGAVFWASDVGKFVVLLMLYNFAQGVIISGALDQWVIRS